MSTNFIKSKGRDGIFMHALENIEEQYEILPAGLYALKDYGNMVEGEKPAFVPSKLPDNLIHFKSGIFNDAVNVFSRFFSPKTIGIYKDLGIGHKVGTIFYGKPGTGKTSLCQIIMLELVEKYGAICCDCTGFRLGFIQRAIGRLRKYQQNPVVIFMDEIEYSIMDEEGTFLTFLDGSSSITNTALIGCTNYIDKIPDRIKNRKSRIKHTFEIKSLPDEVYYEYLQQKIGKTHSNIIPKFTHYASEGQLTLDELKHAITDFVVDDVEIEEACRAVKVKC